MENKKLLYGLIGCGALVMVLMCVGTGVGVWYLSENPDVFDTPFPEGEPGTPSFAPDVPGQSGVSLRLHVETAGGSAPATVGSECTATLSVDQTQSPPMCRARVLCPSGVAYGDGNSGFFPCDEFGEQWRGHDSETTSGDNDAAFTLDTPGGIFTLSDDPQGPFGAYSMSGKVVR